MSSGGGYGQNGGRQQRKRPRDFDDDQYRRPRTSDVLEKLRRDLVNLCDPGNISTTEDIRYVARKIAIEFETPENQIRMLDSLRDCILQLSVKTCHYAAVVSLAGAQNKSFGDAFVGALARSISQAWDTRSWRDLKLLLRLLASMDRCLATTGTTTVIVLQGLLNTLQTSDCDVATISRGHVCRVILLTLPYLLAGTPQDNIIAKEAADSIVDNIRPFVETQLSLFEETKRQNAPLFRLLRQCQQAKMSNWTIHYLPQFLEFFGPDGANDAFDMPAITFGALPQDSAASGLEVQLELFNLQTIKSVPSCDDLAASVFRDQTTDILDLLVANRKDAARFLIDLESYMQPGTFVLRGTPLDKIPSEGPTWKAEDIVVEGIFSELFALPRPRHKPVYYHSVLTELCKLVPQAVAPTFGRAIRAIYGNLENMEPELAYRAWDWFSHHLSNFGFNWKWQEWVPDLTLPPLHPKSAFIRETIMKEAELSYNQRIKTTLPVDYHQIIADEAAGPNFPRNEPEDTFYADSTALLSALAGDEKQEQIDNLLSAITRKATDQGLGEEHETLTILIHTILQLGHQSFSHALNTIERHLDLLQARCNASSSSRLTTVAAVFEFWSGRPFIASTLLQKLLNYRIISPMSVIEHVLLHGNVSSSVLWELLDTTFDKVEKRVIQVQERLTRMNADQASQAPAADGNSAPASDAGKSEEVMNLEKTWIDVQGEQREVLTFTLHHFLTQLDNVDTAEEWTEYWTKGLFHSFLRRNKDRIMMLEDEAVLDSRVQSILSHI